MLSCVGLARGRFHLHDHIAGLVCRRRWHRHRSGLVRAEPVRGHPVDVLVVDQHRPHDQLDVDHSDHELDVDHSEHQLDVDHSDHQLDVDHSDYQLDVDHPDYELDLDHPDHQLDIHVAPCDDLEHVDDGDAHHEHD